MGNNRLQNLAKNNQPPNPKTEKKSWFGDCLLRTDLAGVYHLYLLLGHTKYHHETEHSAENNQGIKLSTTIFKIFQPFTADQGD